jgi:hypothetical protein
MLLSAKFSKNAGTTLLELIIVLFISSLVVIGAFRAYRFTIISADRERDKSELQGNMVTVSNIIEKDIRMAGCGLPGNGLRYTLSDAASDELTLFSNESGIETTLGQPVQPAHNQAIVADATGFVSGGGICLAAEGVDTVYRVVTGIDLGSPAGFNTIHFSDAVNTINPFPAGERVFPTTCIRYTVTGAGPEHQILRTRNNNQLPIGGTLDSLNIVPKNSAGAAVGGVSKSAAVLTVVIGGYIGSDGNRTFIADSSEINIRNRN